MVFTVIRRCRKNEEVKHGNHQRPHEILNQGCGRWGTSGIAIANLYLLHTVVVYYRNSSFKMRKFSSNKFNLYIFQDKYLPQTVPVTALEHTDASDILEDTNENCVDFINDCGGFTVMMWYYRGGMNYNSLIFMATQGNEVQVDASGMNYHII